MSKEIKQDINYTVMEENEYLLRRDIADSFLDDIMQNDKNLVIIDTRIKNKKNHESKNQE